MPTAQETADRWATQAGSAGQRYVEGAQRTDKDPTALAAAQAQKALNNYTQAITSGRFQRGLAAAGRQGWLAGVTTKGAQNYAVGVAAAKTKYQTAMSTWLPITASIVSQIEQMPNNTIQDAQARAARFMELMHAAKQSQ